MAKHEFKRPETQMKVTLQTRIASPSGNAQPGTVLDLPKEKADELLAGRFAREYDAERDKKSPVGLSKAPETWER